MQVEMVDSALKAFHSVLSELRNGGCDVVFLGGCQAMQGAGAPLITMRKVDMYVATDELLRRADVLVTSKPSYFPKRSLLDSSDRVRPADGLGLLGRTTFEGVLHWSLRCSVCKIHHVRYGSFGLKVHCGMSCSYQSQCCTQATVFPTGDKAVLLCGPELTLVYLDRGRPKEAIADAVKAGTGTDVADGAGIVLLEQAWGRAVSQSKLVSRGFAGMRIGRRTRQKASSKRPALPMSAPAGSQGLRSRT